MLCLAASFAWGLVQPGSLLERDPLWQRVSQSVGQIGSAVGPSGIAVLVDERGWFLAHSSSLPRGLAIPNYTVRIGGRSVVVKRVAHDPETDMVLLGASGWQAGSVPPVRVASGSLASGDKLMAVTLSGPRRAVVSGQRIGQMRPSLRYVPLDEIRLEEGQTSLDGAVAFNVRGELAAVLGATLADQGAFGARGVPGGQGDRDLKNLTFNQQFGPAGLAVGYTFSGALLDRVVAGLCSPTHKVLHPSIGAFFKLTDQVGVTIEALMPGGAAQAAGVKVGDVVLEADGVKIGSPITLAVTLFNQRVGDEMTLKVRRGAETLDLRVRVAAQQE